MKRNDYLELKHNMTREEFKNRIMLEYRFLDVPIRQCIAYKYCLKINGITINYRLLDKMTISEIANFHYDDVKEGAEIWKSYIIYQ